MEKMTTINWN